MRRPSIKNLCFSFMLLLSSCKGNLMGGFGSNQNVNETPTTLESQQELRLADRNYVSSVFTNVFGTSSAVTTIVNTYIKDKLEDFGGPCDPAKTTVLTSTPLSRICAGNYSNSRMNYMTPSTSIREANRIKACLGALSNDNALRTGIANAFETTVDQINFGSLAQPNEEAILRISRLFYRGRVLESTVVSALSNLAASAAVSQAPLESYRLVFLAICESPEWQIL